MSSESLRVVCFYAPTSMILLLENKDVSLVDVHRSFGCLMFRINVNLKFTIRSLLYYGPLFYYTLSCRLN